MEDALLSMIVKTPSIASESLFIIILISTVRSLGKKLDDHHGRMERLEETRNQKLDSILSELK